MTEQKMKQEKFEKVVEREDEDFYSEWISVLILLAIGLCMIFAPSRHISGDLTGLFVIFISGVIFGKINFKKKVYWRRLK